MYNVTMCTVYSGGGILRDVLDFDTNFATGIREHALIEHNDTRSCLKMVPTLFD